MCILSLNKTLHPGLRKLSDIFKCSCYGYGNIKYSKLKLQLVMGLEVNKV